MCNVNTGNFSFEVLHEGNYLIYHWNFILNIFVAGVLDEEEDVLENVNIKDSERYAKNVENKKKKPDYKPYDEPEYDEFGIVSLWATIVFECTD